MNASVPESLSAGRLLRLATVALLGAVLAATAVSAQVQLFQGNMPTPGNLLVPGGRPLRGAGRGSQSGCCYSAPELWVLNTRHLPRCSNLDNGFQCITYQRYDSCRGCFVKETRESFLAQEASMPTLFYVHGNTLKHKGAMKGFWDLYEALRCCPGRKRLVCWSWPAQRVYKTKGLRVREMIRKNLRLKYVYSEYQGYYLAKLVNQMSLSQRVTLSGHSYGAITCSVALHFMGGGCLRGLTLAGGAPVERPNLRGAMISGAFDCDMLLPGHRYGQAFVAAEKILSTFNCHDKTLKKWPKTSWRGQQALGYVGMPARCLGQYRYKLCQINTYPENGRSHYLKPHLKNNRFVSAYCCIAFGGGTSCQPGIAKKLDFKQALAESGEESAAATAEHVQPEAAKQDGPTGTIAESVDEPIEEGSETREDHAGRTSTAGTLSRSGRRTSHFRRNRVSRTRG